MEGTSYQKTLRENRVERVRMESHERIILFERRRPDVRRAGRHIPDDGDGTAVLLGIRFNLFVVAGDAQKLGKAQVSHGRPIADPVDKHVAS